MTDLDEPVDRKRQARRVAYTLFYGMVLVFIGTATVQITLQVFTAPAGAPVDCKTGLRALAESVDAARAASEGAEASPDVAVARFRGALAPVWDDRDRIDRACRGAKDPALISAFDTIERLRYAEENAVRRDALDLAPLRRRVRELLGGPLAGP